MHQEYNLKFAAWSDYGKLVFEIKTFGPKNLKIPLPLDRSFDIILELPEELEGCKFEVILLYAYEL